MSLLVRLYWQDEFHTCRKWIWSSVRESFSRSALVLLSSAASLCILSSTSSAWLTAARSWTRSSSFTSELCFSMDRISLEKTLSLSSTTASVECWRGLSFMYTSPYDTTQGHTAYVNNHSPYRRNTLTLMYLMTYFSSFSASFIFCSDFKQVSWIFFCENTREEHQAESLPLFPLDAKSWFHYQKDFIMERLIVHRPQWHLSLWLPDCDTVYSLALFYISH